MKAVIKGDDFKSTRFIDLTPFTRQLNRTFIRFCSAIGIKDFIEAAVVCE